MATDIAASAKSYTAAQIAANTRAGWFGIQTDIDSSYDGWTWTKADGTTKRHALTLDSNRDSVFAIGNLDISTGKYIGLGAAKGRITFTDAATDIIAFNDADVTVSGDLSVAVAKNIYIGSESTNDSWRLTVSGGSLLVQERVGGTWTTKGTFS